MPTSRPFLIMFWCKALGTPEMAGRHHAHTLAISDYVPVHGIGDARHGRG